MIPDKTRILFLAGIGVALFALGYIFHTASLFGWYRAFSFITPMVYLGMLFYFLKKETEKLLVVFFVLYALSRLATVLYEIEFMASLFLILNSLALLSLVKYASRSVDFSAMNLFYKIIFGLVIAINAYFVYLLIVSVKDVTLSDFHYVMLLFDGACAILLAFVTLLYNHQSGNKASMFFLIAVFVLIFSQVFLVLGYYELGYDENVAVHIARILLIISCLMFVRHNIVKPLTAENHEDASAS